MKNTFNLAKFLTENNLTTDSKKLQEAWKAEFTLEEFDDFMMDRSIYWEDEILEKLPNWSGGDLGEDGFDILTAWEGIRHSYNLKPIYVKELVTEDEEEDQYRALVRVQQLLPKDKSEAQPDVYLVEEFTSGDPDVNWNAISGWFRGTASISGGNGYLLPKNMFAAFETFIEGGAMGKSQQYEPDHDKLTPDKNF